MKGVSIIVPVNGNFNLKPLLDSIYYDDYEVIIIGTDSGYIDSISDKVRFVRSAENRSEARNSGSKLSKYENLLFLDADMDLSDHFLVNAIIDAGKFDALIFPEITLGSGIIARGRRFERSGLYRSLYFEAPRMIRKDVFNLIGGYNKDMNAFEDLDLMSRLLRGNFGIGWSENIIFHHEEDVSVIDYVKKRVYYTHANKEIFLNENQEFSRQLVKIGNRYGCFLNSVRIYRMRSIYYLPFYLVVTLINVLIYVVIK
jgi:hypothetical protein